MTENEKKREHENEDVCFTVVCSMRRRWAQQFIGMLNYMQKLGNIGSTRTVSFLADGDGDFHPKFAIEYTEKITPSEGQEAIGGIPGGISGNGDRHWDAG